MFPPFSLVGQALVRGAKSDKTEAVAVVPDWSTQNWYPQLMQMTSHEPLFGHQQKNLILPQKPSENHPLHSKLQLMIIRVMLLLLIF